MRALKATISDWVQRSTFGFEAKFKSETQAVLKILMENIAQKIQFTDNEIFFDKPIVSLLLPNYYGASLVIIHTLQPWKKKL